MVTVDQTTLFLPPRECMNRPPLPYIKPKLLATYSHRPDRSLAHDDSAMAVYKGAPIGSDLYYGFEDRIERDESVEEHLDGLCEALRRQADQGRRWKTGGLVTWRGMATRLMAAPFEEREGWEMTAVALNGSVYMELYDPPEAKRQRLADQQSWAKQSYVGYSFESYSTGEQAEGPPGWSGTVNTNVQWCCVVESSIEGLPLTLGGEVDCVTSEPATLDKTVELKTNMVIQNARHDATFHKKLLKHWAQSYLLGVPTIEVGFRDNDGILRGLHRFETVKIPRLVSAAGAPWHPNPALANLHAVVDFLTSTILPTDVHPPSSPPLGEDHPLPIPTVWRLAFQPSQGFTLRQVEPETSRWGDILHEDYVRLERRRLKSRLIWNHWFDSITTMEPAPGNTTSPADESFLPDSCKEYNGEQCYEQLSAEKIAIIVVCSLVGLGIIVGIIKWRMRVSNRAHQLKVAQARNKTTP